MAIYNLYPTKHYRPEKSKLLLVVEVYFKVIKPCRISIAIRQLRAVKTMLLSVLLKLLVLSNSGLAKLGVLISRWTCSTLDLQDRTFFGSSSPSSRVSTPAAPAPASVVESPTVVRYGNRIRQGNPWPPTCQTGPLSVRMSTYGLAGRDPA